MKRTFVASSLPTSDKDVSRSLKATNGTFIELQAGKTAREIANEVLELPLRIGDTIIFHFALNNIMQEFMYVSCLQRRLSDSVRIIVARGEHLEEEIPYLEFLRDYNRSAPEDTNYTYKPTSSCCSSGGCSCK
jgi:hypothetical protein